MNIDTTGMNEVEKLTTAYLQDYETFINNCNNAKMEGTPLQLAVIFLCNQLAKTQIRINELQ